MAHECLCSGCSVLWPLTVTRAKLGGGDRITPFSGAAPQFLQPLRGSRAMERRWGQAGPGSAEGALEGRGSGSTWTMDHSRGEEVPRAPAGPNPAGTKPCWEQRDGQRGWRCRRWQSSGLGRGDWQGGEEGQEISQWLYGQRRVSCSSPGAGAALGPHRTRPGPRRTPAPAARQGPRSTRRLEGPCPAGGLAGTGTPLWVWEGFSALVLCGVECCIRGRPALHRHVPCPAPSCSYCALAMGQDTLGPRLGPVWLPTAMLESWVLGHIQAQHLSLGLGTTAAYCGLPRSSG